MNDSLGDRMKVYEQAEAGRKLMPRLPILARIDGRAFHSFTAGLERPFCKGLHDLMVATTKSLVEETNAKVGYTQSDEITLVWYESNPQTQVWFDGKIHKMVSQLGSLATLYFNTYLGDHLPLHYALKGPTFDARVWNVPTVDEAFNCLVWRQQDALRNSVSMAAQSMFSHNELQNKSCDEMQELMFTARGVNWNDYPDWAKSGSFVTRNAKWTDFTTEELEALPPKHNARLNPNLKIKRSVIEVKHFPRLAGFDTTERYNLITEGR